METLSRDLGDGNAQNISSDSNNKLYEKPDFFYDHQTSDNMQKLKTSFHSTIIETETERLQYYTQCNIYILVNQEAFNKIYSCMIFYCLKYTQNYTLE